VTAAVRLNPGTVTTLFATWNLRLAPYVPTFWADGRLTNFLKTAIPEQICSDVCNG